MQFILKEIVMALFDDVKEVVVEQLNVNPDEVKMESKFVEDLGADSLDVVELVMALEEKFNIEIPDDQAEKIQTVGDAVKYIEENK
jgi:acyl carrier protein